MAPLSAFVVGSVFGFIAGVALVCVLYMFSLAKDADKAFQEAANRGPGL